MKKIPYSNLKKGEYIQFYIDDDTFTGEIMSIDKEAVLLSLEMLTRDEDTKKDTLGYFPYGVSKYHYEGKNTPNKYAIRYCLY